MAPLSRATRERLERDMAVERAREREQERRDLDRLHSRRRERDAAREQQMVANDSPVAGSLLDVWLQDQPGHPLGVGMPMGAPLREDGETHTNAWRRILRADPCAYCDARVSGTVDHVAPRANRKVGTERWVNLVGACQQCNTAKAAKPLLIFLAGKRGLKPVGALDRTAAEWREVEEARRRAEKRRRRDRFAA